MNLLDVTVLTEDSARGTFTELEGEGRGCNVSQVCFSSPGSCFQPLEHSLCGSLFSLPTLVLVSLRTAVLQDLYLVRGTNGIEEET